METLSLLYDKSRCGSCLRCSRLFWPDAPPPTARTTRMPRRTTAAPPPSARIMPIQTRCSATSVRSKSVPTTRLSKTEKLPKSLGLASVRSPRNVPFTPNCATTPQNYSNAPSSTVRTLANTQSRKKKPLSVQLKTAHTTRSTRAMERFRTMTKCKAAPTCRTQSSREIL